MDSTVFLAQLWGPVILAIGIGMFVSRSFYLRIYRDIEKGAFAALIFGGAAMAAGIAQIGVHNVWDTPLEILVSLLGWGLLVKGALFLIVPNFADRWGDYAARANVVPVVGVAMLVIGGYLSWLGYMVG